MKNSKIIQKFLDSGYQKDVQDFYNAIERTNTLLQKRVEDTKGIRYFINAWYYPAQVINGHSIKEHISFKVQFKDKNGTPTADIGLFTQDIEEAESVFNDMWRKMKYGYY